MLVRQRHSMFRASFLLVLLAFMCAGEEIKTPLSVVNPLHLVQNCIKNVKPSNHEDMLFAQNLQKLIFHVNNTPDPSDDPCAKSIVQFVVDLTKKEPYTLSMIDAWGKPESGFLQGNARWFGLYDECLRSKAAEFDGKYCFLDIGKAPPNPFGPPQPPLVVGGCFPDSCSESNITSLFSRLNTAVVADCPIQYTEWKVVDTLAVVLLSVLFCLVTASTMYDYITNKRENKELEFSNTVMLHGPSGPTSEQLQIKHGSFHQVMTSFSLIKNTKRLLSTKQRSGDINCLHGMRFLSMTWVILGHSFLFALMFSNNIYFFISSIVEHWEMQGIVNATFSVDTFFYLSGLLVAYLGLRQLNKTDGRMNVPLMYLYRYIRLTPVYAFVILIQVSLWLKLGGGPLWSTAGEQQVEVCHKYWYTNLLYFNNLYPVALTDECYAVGWYLANDMQFYLVAPLFLYLLYKLPNVGLGLMSFFTVASIAVTGAFSSHTKQQPQAEMFGLLAESLYSMINHKHVPVNGTSLISGEAAAQYSVYMSDLYAKPWCRIGAYIVGMTTGYILHANNNKVKMPKIVVAIGWLVAALTNCVILYCLYPSSSKGQALDINTAAFYNAVTRPVWCIGLAWVTIACVSGYGGPVNALLSWKGFIPLSRLTYCSYLIHPLVLQWFLVNNESLFHFNVQLLIMAFLATLVLTTLLAYVVAMLIEFPLVELMKILQNRNGNTEVAARRDSNGPLLIIENNQ